MHQLPAAWLPSQVNTGSWLVHYTLPALQQRLQQDRVVLPICSFGTPPEDMEKLAPLVLPPLFHEALNAELKPALLARIEECFPYLAGTRKRAALSAHVEVIELPPREHQPPKPPRVLAFSVDTAVEQHGPHLPLATDTIQSYGVLARAAAQLDGVTIGPPLDYGHLTWGLPLGLSIDIPPPLLTRYVCGYANALIDWLSPEALYVVDVHGSPVHRQAIQDGLAASRAGRWLFRWLYEPLVEFASERGDQHAGGVETAMIEQIGPALIDPAWWPDRCDMLEAEAMSFERALELTPDLPAFIEYAETGDWNGIVGRPGNYFQLDRPRVFQSMVDLATSDLASLLHS